MLYAAEMIRTLQAIPWFLELKPAQLEKLAALARVCEYGSDQVLFNEGEKINALMVLLTGEVTIKNFVPTQGVVCTFTAQPLDIIGWDSLTPVVRQRTSSARTTCPTSLLVFEPEALKQLCDQDHDIGYVVMRRLANVVASRLLTTRLHLLDIVSQLGGH